MGRTCRRLGARGCGAVLTISAAAAESELSRPAAGYPSIDLTATAWEGSMHSIFYIIGVVVVVLALLNFIA